jgi:hypothetical protein
VYELDHVVVSQVISVAVVIFVASAAETDDGTQTIVVTVVPIVVTTVLVKELAQVDVEQADDGTCAMVYVVLTGLPLESIAEVTITTEVVKLPVHVERVVSGSKTAMSVVVTVLPLASVVV